MNETKTKVNIRYYHLLVFVCVCIGAVGILSPRPIFAQNIPIPTDPPDIIIPTPTLSSQDFELEEEEVNFQNNSNQNYRAPQSYEQIMRQSQKEIWSILGRLFSGAAQTAATITPGQNPLINSSSMTINSSLQNIIPQTPVTAGNCQTLETQAMTRLENNFTKVNMYLEAAKASGVPWEIIAAIHYIENTNGNGSCTSGTPIGEKEPDSGKYYSTQLESCIDAANVYKTRKKEWALDFMKNNGFTNPSELEMMIAQFTAFNSVTQGECAMAYTNGAWRYTGGVWQSDPSNKIPDRGQCSNGLGGERYMGDRHVYGTRCMDNDHVDMYFHFHFGGNIRKYDSHIGAIAFIRALQKKFATYATPPTDTNSPVISYTPPTGNYVYFNQCDPKYQNPSWISCGSNGSPLNCYSGCGPTTIAQVIATYANASYTPLHSVSKFVSWGAINCSGSGYSALSRIVNEDGRGKITLKPNIGAGGNLYRDAQVMKEYTDAGNTLLATASYTPCCGHWLWIVKIDENYNVWANDVYWLQQKYVGNASAPINLTALMNGGYPYKGVTNIDVTNIWPVVIN